ncbi:tryptophan-rich sensory protein [Mycobacterium kiyosense]|uniref:Tryptophan-rich sensory protein n=1 Tax=Mycobacterium kiyosense TaxID=2871094 RepID=A0AA37Q2G9_9MYCO|nr:TspO/MBR family protein [Mycobacterium kiyosense]GLB82056.1 tryptophan-rich sensory protein [Mycobacterium kiyosense]
MNRKTLAATGLAVAAVAVSGTVASPARTPGWYEGLRKPSYVPPGPVFPVAWTSLYTDIAVSSATAIDRYRETGQDDEARKYVAALSVNLAINAVWSWLFFGWHKLGTAALGAVALTASSADLTRRTAAADRRAGLALLPYPLWCVFATLLATRVWQLNR